jgi:hypothetical protein
MRSSIVIMKDNFFRQHSSVFTTNRRTHQALCNTMHYNRPSSHDTDNAQAWAHQCPRRASILLHQQKAYFWISWSWVTTCFPHSALTFAGRFIVVHSCLITSDSLLQKSFSFMVLLQKLHACFHLYLFVLICKLLWHAPCTDFAVPKVVMDDGICISIADVQLLSYISDTIELFSWIRA